MSWIHYLMESNLYLVAFYALYYIIFRGETYYQLNRVYLLASTGMAFIIPVIQIGILNPAAPQLQDAPVKIAADGASWPVINYLLSTYGIIALLLLIKFSLKIYKLVKLTYTHKISAQKEFKLIELTDQNNAFSFFNYLFISPGLTLSSTVIHHELIHIKQKHSWDIIYLELLKIINWFNPVVYLLQNSMKEVHEFIADSKTVGNDENASVYVDFLVSNAYGINENTLTNTFFNKSLLKKRIMMLHQKRSGNAARLKYLLVLPLTGGLLCASTITFAKDYGWINLLPAKDIISHQQKDTIKIPPPSVPAISVKEAPKLKLKNPPPPPIPPAGVKAPKLKLKNPPPPPAPPVKVGSSKGEVKFPPPVVKKGLKNGEVKFPSPVVKKDLKNGEVKFPPPVVKKDLKNGEVKFPPPVVKKDS